MPSSLQNFFKILLIISTAVYGSQAFAAKAHTHGESTWSFAIEGDTGRLLIEAPGQSILGFEHLPKEKADHLKISQALQKFEKMMPKMVQVPGDRSCEWTKKNLEVRRDENDKNHCDVTADFEIYCKKDLPGATLTFQIQKYFPALKTVQAEVVMGNIQKSQVIDRPGLTLELK